MKLMRQRKPSLNTMIGITQAKRTLAKKTGMPTTKSGRKYKTWNALTNGEYGKFVRKRAEIKRPYNMLKHPPTPTGCMTWILLISALICVVVTILF